MRLGREKGAGKTGLLSAALARLRAVSPAAVGAERQQAPGSVVLCLGPQALAWEHKVTVLSEGRPGGPRGRLSPTAFLKAPEAKRQESGPWGP